MTTPKTCVECGEAIEGESLWGLCTTCLYHDCGEPDPDGAGERRRRFGNYELGEVLGRGGMGVVYKAIQTSPRRTVALKMILDSDLASERARRRFRLEAEMAAKLDHPHIVPIYEVDEEEGQPFLSMKWIAGETLRRKIDQGEFSLASEPASGRSDFRERGRMIVRLMATVTRAVQHAHQNGVLHRDLKPGNIIVDREGAAHLTDFGLAQALDSAEAQLSSSTQTGTLVGTPAYMSPEQAQGRRLSAASDIYSLGAIFYEMLTGRPPFQASTPLETLRLVLHEEATQPRRINPRVDKDLDTICLKCLEKDPSRRYLTAGALADDLERWLRQEPIGARPAGFALRSARWVSRNRLGTALIVSLCGGLTLAILLLAHALARQRELDLHRANNIQRLSLEMEEMWNDPAKRFVVISSSTLADLADLSPQPPDPLASRLLFGKTINHEPLGQAMQYAPFLSMLERRMEKMLQRPALIDLHFYKSENDALLEMNRGALLVQRMDPVLYVISKSAGAQFAPIVWERSLKEAVIFASKESGITNLSQLAGKRLVLGPMNSAVTFWAKVHLARTGLRANQFESCRYINGANENGEDSLRNSGADRDPGIQANKRAIHQVFDRKADIGVALRRQFELARHSRGGLQELHAYSVPSDLYVAAPEFDTNVLRILRQCLSSFGSAADKELLARLSENVVIEGFDAVSDHDFDDIRSALQKEVALFDRSL